jgi:ribonuclease HI
VASFNGKNVVKRSGANDTTTSSMRMEIEAVTAAIVCLVERPTSHAGIVTDSQSMLRKTEKSMLRKEWFHLLDNAHIGSLTWIFCLGHAGARGNEIADRRAGSATVQGVLQMGKPEITNAVLDRLCKEDESEWEENVHVRRMIEMG